MRANYKQKKHIIWYKVQEYVLCLSLVKYRDHNKTVKRSDFFSKVINSSRLILMHIITTECKVLPWGKKSMLMMYMNKMYLLLYLYIPWKVNEERYCPLSLRAASELKTPFSVLAVVKLK